MRTFIIILCIGLLCTAAVAIYLFATTPDEPARLTFPLSAAQQELVSRVPADADAWAYIPSPAVLVGRLAAHPLTAEAMAKWAEERPLPPPSFLGHADAVVWRSEKRISYAVRFDPVRAWIARIWTVFSHVETSWDGRILVINPSSETIPPSAPPAELRLTPGLQAGDALIVQRSRERGAFPPIGRPAVTSVLITPRQIELVSRSTADASRPVLAPPTVSSLPRSAMLAIHFADPPRVLGDVDRLVAADVGALVEGGGTIALYDVDTGTLLPRPFSVIALPATDRAREVVERYAGAVDAVGERRESRGELLVAFDRKSAGRYVADTSTPMPWPANEWAMRIDPASLVPVLRKIGDNPALRFATPRIHRGARDLRRWIGALEKADRVEAAASVSGPFEELRVRVATK